MSGIISDSSLLELERQRSQLTDILRTKGINVPQDSTMQNNITACASLNGNIYDDMFTNSAIHFISQTLTLISNSNIFKLNVLNDYFLPSVVSTSTSLRDSIFSHIYLPNLVDGYVSDLFYAISGCENLILPKLINGTSSSLLGVSSVIRCIAPKSTHNNIFYNGTITNTQILDIKGATSYLGTGYNNALELLILRDTANITPLTVANKLNNVNLKIYVPTTLLNTYKTATNWSVYASQIFALEGSDYESETWYETEQWYTDEMNYWKSLYGEHIFDEIVLEEEEE